MSFAKSEVTFTVEGGEQRITVKNIKSDCTSIHYYEAKCVHSYYTIYLSLPCRIVLSIYNIIYV